MNDDILERLNRYVTPRNDDPYNELVEALGLETQKKKEEPSVLPHNQEALLSNIGRFPCLDRKSRQDNLGWNAQTMQNAVEALEGTYIRPVKMKRGGKGSGYIAYELTDEAKRYMMQRGIHFTKLHGDLRHHCVVESWVNEMRQNGYKATTEASVGGFIVDALAEKEVKIGLEVVGSNNVKRDQEKFQRLTKNLDELKVVCLDKDLKTVYQRELQKRLNDEELVYIEIKQV